MILSIFELSKHNFKIWKKRHGPLREKSVCWGVGDDLNALNPEKTQQHCKRLLRILAGKRSQRYKTPLFPPPDAALNL